MIDLKSLEASDSVDIHISHPEIGPLYADDKKKKPVIISVYGPGSDEYDSYERKHQRKLSRIMSKQGIKGIYRQSPEEQEMQNLDRLEALTAKVDNMNFDGKPITTDNIRDIYENPKLGWLRNQVSSKLANWDNYLGE